MSGPTGGGTIVTPRVKVNIQGGNYTITPADYLVVSTLAGANITLPATPTAGDQYDIKNRSAGVINVIGTVDGAVNPTIAAGGFARAIYTGTEWVSA